MNSQTLSEQMKLKREQERLEKFIGGIKMMNGVPSAIFVIFITSIWPIIINTAVGIRNIPQDYRNVAAVVRLNPLEFFWKIMIPSAAPYIFTGLRIGIGHPGVRHEVANWVLRKPPLDDRIAIDQCVASSLATLPLLLAGDLAGAMHKIHAKPPRPKPPRPADPPPPAGDPPDL